MSDCHGCSAAAGLYAPPSRTEMEPPHTVALVGPPNCGKTTLFNRLTGLRQKVANFPGVTVEQHTGMAELADRRQITLIDLPGIYSLNPRSEDEQVATMSSPDRCAGAAKPDAILLVLDSTNLRRPPDARGPDSALGLPDPGRPQHGRRPPQPRRQGRSRRALRANSARPSP